MRNHPGGGGYQHTREHVWPRERVTIVMNLHSKNNNLQHTTPDIDHCQTARIAELLQYYATAADTRLTHTGIRQRGTRTFMHIHALNAVRAPRPLPAWTNRKLRRRPSQAGRLNTSPCLCGRIPSRAPRNVLANLKQRCSCSPHSPNTRGLCR